MSPPKGDTILQKRFFDLYSGMGGIRMGLERAGWSCVGFCELDKNPVKLYRQNFTCADEFYWPDATTLPLADLPEFDLLAAGFPCQPWSNAGKRAGFDDARGTLFFEIARILEAKQPRAILLENVKGLLSEPMKPSFDRMIEILQGLGYAVSWKVLNSRDYGVPQHRERIFFVGMKHAGGLLSTDFPWPEGSALTTRLSDVLDPDPPAKYRLSERMTKTLLEHLRRNKENGSGWGLTILTGDEDHSPTIQSTMFKGPGAAGRPAVLSPSVTDNFGRAMTTVMLKESYDDGQRTIRSGNESSALRGEGHGYGRNYAASLLRHGAGRGWEAKVDGTSHALKGADGGHSKVHVATFFVNHTAPHYLRDTRDYRLDKYAQAVKASSSGTADSRILQVKRYSSEGDHLVREYAESPTLTQQMGTGGHNVPLVLHENLAGEVTVRSRETGTLRSGRQQNAVLSSIELRRLTPRECLRLQGFPDTYTIEGISDTAAYKAVGNSVTIHVVTAVGRSMTSWINQ